MTLLNKFAVIFDMDGVIVDNNRFHSNAWKEFCRIHGFSLSDDEFNKYISGKINKDTLAFLFKRKLSADEIEKYGKEKEMIFRQIYKPYMQLPEGLTDLLTGLKQNKFKTAIATSAPVENVNFVFENLDIKKYFDAVIDESQINNGKPNPEIYLKAADRIGMNPAECIVIEDSTSGIRAAVNAGMKVIAITTTHNKMSLGNADMVIDSFKELNIDMLSGWFKKI
jgi:beta-phosphoglucomutase family hydrolase